MTYLKDGFEHLDAQELRIYRVIQRLNAAGRSTNSSQVANAAGIGRTTVTGVCHHLKARGFLANAGEGAAYHWRATSQPVPYSTADRHAAIALKARQRELNDQIRQDRNETLEAEQDRLDAAIAAAEASPFLRRQENDPIRIAARLEYLRGEIRAERISYSELIELQNLAPHIEPGDVELLEPAGVPEFPDDND